jgi:uncharacterized protein with PIN domain
VCRVVGEPLLFVGDDFTKTDLDVAAPLAGEQGDAR